MYRPECFPLCLNEPLSKQAEFVTAAAAANPRAFPPLVDMYSRTLGAAFVDERAGGGVSCKIASFLTPTSTLFVIDTHEKKIISTGYTPYSDADYIEPLPVVPEPINLLQVSEFEVCLPKGPRY